VFLNFELQYKISEDGKYDRLLTKESSVANADEVWKAWYKKAKIIVLVVRVRVWEGSVVTVT
jgi:hypothetical protein